MKATLRQRVSELSANREKENLLKIEGILRLENPAIFVESETKWFHTSEVKSSEKISDTKFKVKTKNSTYEVEVLS